MPFVPLTKWSLTWVGICVWFGIFVFLWTSPPTIFQWWSSQGPQFQLSWTGSSGSPFSVLLWRVTGAAAWLTEGLVPRCLRDRGLQLCRNWAAHFGNVCLNIFARYVWSTVWGRYRRDPYCPKPPCSGSPLFPQPFCLQQPSWRFWRQVTFTVQSWFVSQGASCCELNDMLVPFGEKKDRFYHNAYSWSCIMVAVTTSLVVVEICMLNFISSPHIELQKMLHSFPLFSSSPPPPSGQYKLFDLMLN